VSTLRLSSFNLYLDDFPAQGSSLIYNSLTGAFLEVPTETRRALEQVDRGELDASQVDIDPQWLDEDAQFLVPSQERDEQAFDDWYETMRSSSAMMSVTVSVTFACNLDCSYCCQADVLDGKTMSHATGAATATWLAERAIAIGAGCLSLCFVGGEPLLQKARIEQIVRDARALLAPHRIPVFFSLITNGVFMTRELVEAWVPLGLRGAQVTLDGDASTHSITRRSKKNAPDSYPTIFKNVIDSADLIAINVNGNYQPDTIHGFPGLVEELRAAGLKAGTPMSFSPAVTALGAPSQSGTGSCTMGGANSEWMLGLKDLTARAGYNPGEPLRIGPCSFHKLHAYAIDPHGHIYKCPGFLGKPEWALGEVTTGLTGAYDRVVAARPHRSACGTCAHRPDCAGGCIAAEWVAKGKEEGINCEGEFFEKNGSELLKRKYAFTMAAETGGDPFDIVPAIEMTALDLPALRADSPGRRSSALRVLA
jgi:uncharacterized protein